MITRLIEIFKILELDLAPEDVADILWLSSHIDESVHIQQEKVNGETYQKTPDIDIKTTYSKNEDKISDQILDDNAKSLTKSTSTKVHLSSSKTDNVIHTGTGGMTFLGPTTSALPGKLNIGRALRPLMRRIPSRNHLALDEEATAKRIAEVKQWIPVLNPTPSRWLDVVLVVDEFPSMVIWKQTIIEFQKVLSQRGAFRNIQTWSVDTSSEGDNVRLCIKTDLRDFRNSRHPRELIDPLGQRLILVISDCVSTAWYNGKIAQLLDIWGKHNVVSIVQVLPQRLWNRTALGNNTPVDLCSLRPGTPNRLLEIKTPWYKSEQSHSNGIPIPVITLEPTALRPWAYSVAGMKNLWVTGSLIHSNIDTIEERPEQKEFDDEASAEKRIQIFRDTASPLAQKLAGYLQSFL